MILCYCEDRFPDSETKEKKMFEFQELFLPNQSDGKDDNIVWLKKELNCYAKQTQRLTWAVGIIVAIIIAAVLGLKNQIYLARDLLWYGVVINDDSSLFTSSHFEKLKEWIPKAASRSHLLKLDLLYKGSRDGFHAQTFHTKCDSKSPTITFIKSQTYGRIFGGYTEQTWNHGGFKRDEYAFLFSLTHNEKYPVSQPQFAIYGHSNYLAIFGGSGHDICIYDNSNSKSSSNSNFPSSFKCSKFNTITVESQAYLAGSHSFKVEEIEVYQIVWV